MFTRQIASVARRGCMGWVQAGRPLSVVREVTAFGAQKRWCQNDAGKSSVDKLGKEFQNMTNEEKDMVHLEVGEEDQWLGGKGVGSERADMALVFECRVCETQATKQFSKLAYTKGVVLIECPGCKNKHVIADNLGWFFDENNNIEKQMAAEGNDLERVSVSQNEYKSFLKGGTVDMETGELKKKPSEEGPKQ